MPSRIFGRTTVRDPQDTIVVPDGNVSYPGMCFKQNPQTGLYYDQGNIGITVDGQQKALLTATDLVLYANMTTPQISGNGSTLDNVNQPLPAPFISNVSLVNDAWSPINDLVLTSNSAEVYVLVNGSDFQPGAVVKVGNTLAQSTTYASPSVLRVNAPVLQNGTYDVTVVNADGVATTRLSAVTYSDSVVWITDANLISISGEIASFNLETVADSNVIYSNVTSVPPGLSLSGNVLSGTLPTVANVESIDLYTVTLRAVDEEQQSADKEFYIVNAVLPTVSSITAISAFNEFTFSVILLDDLAFPSNDTGYAQLTGQDFHGGMQFVVTQGGTAWPQETFFVSPTTLRVKFTGVTMPGVYSYEIRVTGFPVLTSVDSLQFRDRPIFTQSAYLGIVQQASDFSFDLSIPEAANVTYTDGDIPSDTSLTANGIYSGNITAITDDANVRVTIQATNEYLLDSTRNFYLDYQVQAKVIDTFVSTGTSYHSSVITRTLGNVEVWVAGYDPYGNLGKPWVVASPNPNPVDIRGYGSLNGQVVKEIIQGHYFSFAIDTENRIHSWGYNYFGQAAFTTNINTGNRNDTPQEVTNNGSFNGRQIVFISCGAYHALAVDSTGGCHSWGYNYYGELGRTQNLQNSNANQTPVEISNNGSLSGRFIVQTSSGWHHAGALDDQGHVHMWGYNQHGQCGFTTNSGNGNPNYTPTDIASRGALAGRKIVQLSCGSYHTLALDDQGICYSWGYNYYGDLGVTTNVATSNANNTPFSLETRGALNGKFIVKVYAAHHSSYALDNEGRLYAWGYNYYGQLGSTVNNGSGSANPTPFEISDQGSLAGRQIKDISAGHLFVIAQTTDNHTHAFGYNNQGQLGITANNLTNNPNPIPVDTTAGYIPADLFVDTQYQWVSVINNTTYNSTDTAVLPLIINNIPGIFTYSGGYLTMQWSGTLEIASACFITSNQQGCDPAVSYGVTKLGDGGLYSKYDFVTDDQLYVWVTPPSSYLQISSANNINPGFQRTTYDFGGNTYPSYTSILLRFTMDSGWNDNFTLSTILTTTQLQVAADGLISGATATLLFRASRDGYTSQAFHAACDSQAPLFFVFKASTGYIATAYTSVAFTSIGSYVTATSGTNWLNNLWNGSTTSTSKFYNTIYTQYSLYDNSSYGPTFGGGHDLYIPNNWNVNGGYTNTPHSYAGATNTTLFGVYSGWTIPEMEVYKIA